MKSPFRLNTFTLPAVILLAGALAGAVSLVRYGHDPADTSRVDDVWWSDAAGAGVLLLAVVFAALVSRPASRSQTSPRRRRSSTLGAFVVAGVSLAGAVWLLHYEPPYAGRLLNVYYEEPWWRKPAAVAVVVAGVAAAGGLLRRGTSAPRRPGVPAATNGSRTAPR